MISRRAIAGFLLLASCSLDITEQPPLPPPEISGTPVACLLRLRELMPEDAHVCLYVEGATCPLVSPLDAACDRSRCDTNEWKGCGDTVGVEFEDPASLATEVQGTLLLVNGPTCPAAQPMFECDGSSFPGRTTGSCFARLELPVDINENGTLTPAERVDVFAYSRLFEQEALLRGDSVMDYCPEAAVRRAEGTDQTPPMITFRLHGPGLGSIRSEPEGQFTCDKPSAAEATCTVTLLEDTYTVVIAPDANSVLGAVSANCTTNGDRCTFTADVDKTIDIELNAAPRTLTVTKQGPGAVTSTVVAIDGTTFDCPEGTAECALDYPHGTSVRLTANAAAGFGLDGWMVDGMDGCPNADRNTCTVTMTKDLAVGVTFAEGTEIAIEVLGTGTVVSTPAGIDCSRMSASACAATFTPGIDVTLSATSTQTDETFSRWADLPCASSSDANCELTVGDVPLRGTAVFAYPLTLEVSGPGDLTTDTSSLASCSAEAMMCTAPVDFGTVVRVDAAGRQTAVVRSMTLDGAPFTPGSTVLVDGTHVVSAEFGYGLTVNVAGPGTVDATQGGIVGCTEAAPCSTVYPAGQHVDLVATVAPGTVLASCTSTDLNATAMGTTCALDMTQTGAVDLSLEYTFTIQASGGGTVSCNGGTCSSSYPPSTAITLSATETTGCFVQWLQPATCAGSMAVDCPITMTGPVTAEARFGVPFALDVAITGSGQVTSDIGGLSCSTGGTGTCSSSFCRGNVTLTAQPSGGAVFGSWQGCPMPSGATCVVPMNQAQSVTAEFEWPITLQPDPDGAITCTTGGNACGASVADTATVTFQRSCNTGFEPGVWSGDCAGEPSDTCTLSATSSITVGATCVALPALTLEVEGPGLITPDAGPTCEHTTFSCANAVETCTSTRTAGTVVSLTATSSAGSAATFVRWEGGCVGTGPCQVTLNTDTTVRAVFGYTATATIATACPGGTGSSIVSTPAGISTAIGAAGTTSAVFDVCVGIQLTATATGTALFGGWNGACSAEVTNVCSLTMDQPQTTSVDFPCPVL